MNLTFNKGVVVVAGGSGGIGEAVCKRFAQTGAHVVFTYYSNANKASDIIAEIESTGGKAEAERLDLSDHQAVDALLASVAQRYGTIAHVIYAAGPSFDFAKIGDIPVSDWQRVINADVNGAFNLFQSAVRIFREQNGGNLIAVITAAVESVPKGDIMSASPKAAIEMLIRGVAKESGSVGVRANCVGPGWINAGLGKRGIEEQLTSSQIDKIKHTIIPLQRFGEADDIAYAVLFLCSQQAGFISGQTLAVDGGAQI